MYHVLFLKPCRPSLSVIAAAFCVVDLRVERWIIISMMVVCYAKDIVKVDDRRISELSDAPLDMD
jgi:hypothetical protein